MNVPELLKMDADDVIVAMRSCPIKDATSLFYGLLDAFKSGSELESHNAKAGLYTIFERLREGNRVEWGGS